ncbi:MAG: response regulator [Methylovulum sp.]|nr:response regulator [Methylovulum sp.]
MNNQPCVFIVDDDYAVRDSIGLAIETAGLNCLPFESAEHFLESYSPGTRGCLLLDVNMPGLSGLELQAELSQRNIRLPIIFLTGYGDIPTTVRAIKAGAVDFLTKPIPNKLLIARIQAMLEQETQDYEQFLSDQTLRDRLTGLTTRELEVLPLLIAGYANKEIARQLDISFRTVEIHRARVFKKAGVTTLVELAKLYEACNFLIVPKPN